MWLINTVHIWLWFCIDKYTVKKANGLFGKLLNLIDKRNGQFDDYERYLIAEQIMDIIEFELSIAPKISLSKKVLAIWKKSNV